MMVEPQRAKAIGRVLGGYTHWKGLEAGMEKMISLGVALPLLTLFFLLNQIRKISSFWKIQQRENRYQ
jgi:hypothetical protein